MDWTISLSLFVVVFSFSFFFFFAPVLFISKKTLVISRPSPSPLIWLSILYLCQWAGTRLGLSHGAQTQTQIWHIWHLQQHSIVGTRAFCPPIRLHHAAVGPAARHLLASGGNYLEATLLWAHTSRSISLVVCYVPYHETRSITRLCVFIQGVLTCVHLLHLHPCWFRISSREHRLNLRRLSLF